MFFISQMLIVTLDWKLGESLVFNVVTIWKKYLGHSCLWEGIRKVLLTIYGTKLEVKFHLRVLKCYQLGVNRSLLN